MFVDAIESANEFTRPIYFIDRYYGSSEVNRGTATLFFINADGWALTCRHVAEVFIATDQLRERRSAFVSERSALSSNKRREHEKALERKYGFKRGEVYERDYKFMGCANGNLTIEFLLHPAHDLALVKFSGFDSLGVSKFPVFAKDGGELKQGLSLCRLGFPFPEFTNFAYNSGSDTIEWTNEGQVNTPRFPIDGMVTRGLVAADGSVWGFELSTPGLRGQSGGPAFDKEGVVWGMQSATGHLDLDFDVDLEVRRGGRKVHVKESAVLHVGHCVHVDVLKSLMREHNVEFSEA